jgi:hypothetical protein
VVRRSFPAALPMIRVSMIEDPRLDIVAELGGSSLGLVRAPNDRVAYAPE